MTERNRKIVVTRPVTQARSFVNHLCASQNDLMVTDFLVEPMLSIEYLPVDVLDLSIYDGVIVTSQHGGQVYAEMRVIGLPVFSVGSSYGACELSASSAQDLVEAICGDCPRQQLRFLYFRGKHVAFDMKGVLETAWYRVDEVVCYEACAAEQFSSEFLSGIEVGNIGAVSFFSKRSAEIFMQLAKNSQVFDRLRGIKALCISKAVLEYVYPVFGDNAFCAVTPDAQGMSALIAQTNRDT